MPTDRDIEILDLINTLAREATATMQRSLREAELGLVAMEARTLRFIARHPGCTQSDIVRESGRDKAQIARVVKVLLERGEIRRRPEAVGEKRQPLEVTQPGETSHARAESLRNDVAKAMASGLGAGERRELVRMLRHMVERSREPEDS